MRRKRRGRSTVEASAALLLVAALGVACRGHEGRPAERPRPSLVSEVSALPAFITPGVWRYHPREAARVNAELTLPSGDRVLAGRRGERWLVKPSGALEAAAALAPEDLVGLLTTASGTFVFVGASGVSYEARTPTGPFFRSSAPLEPLVSVTSAGSAILGIRRDRGLLRSDDGGATWKAVGPSGPKFVSVALGQGKSGLALAVPEKLYETHDAGHSFEPLSVSSVGAFSVERSPGGEFSIVSALGTFRYRAGAPPSLERAAGTSAAPPDLKPPRGPDAGALNEGRAVTTGGNYLELALRDKGLGWDLVSGPLAGPLSARELPQLASCVAVRLAAFERYVRVACFREGAEATTQGISLWASDDDAKSFNTLGAPIDGNLGSFRMALGEQGTLLLSGVCAQHNAGAGCAPRGIARLGKGERTKPPVVVRPSTGKPKLVREDYAAATPSLADTALALAFSQDGRVAYAVGRRTKGGGLALFVSRDGGRSFEAQDLSVPTGEVDGGDERWDSGGVGVRVDALMPAEDGSVALSLSRYRYRSWLVLDETGRVLSVAKPPESRALLGVAGSRALAVAPATNEVWESLDGGSTFQSLGRLPIDLCKGASSCEVPVACTSGGCALGTDLSRLGWGAAADEDSFTQPAIAPTPVDYSVPRLKTPIACTLDSSSWQELTGASDFPTAFQASLGNAAWFASASDPGRAAAWVWVAPHGGKRAERVSLLAPTERGKSYAMHVSDQIEGVAAVRYVVPDSSGSAHLTGVELAWTNLLEGKTRRVSAGDGGAYSPGDYSRDGLGRQEADPALLSIAEGGLYLRLHKAAGDNQPTLFFDGQRSETVPAVSWPNVGVRGTHSEMARVDGEHVPLLLVGRGSGVVRARLSSGHQELEAFATGALDPARFGLTQSSNIAYLGQRAGQVIETFDSASARAEAKLFLFRAKGAVLEPPIDVPTQLSLGDKVERCSAATEASTARIVAAPYPGTRHPVLVSDGGDAPQAFLTGYAVLHGTPEAPCVSMFDGEPIATDGATAPLARVLLPVGDLSRAYLFRVGAQGPEAKLEYHGLSCRLDPSVEVPPELYRAPGALVPRLR